MPSRGARPGPLSASGEWHARSEAGQNGLTLRAQCQAQATFFTMTTLEAGSTGQGWNGEFSGHLPGACPESLSSFIPLSGQVSVSQSVETTKDRLSRRSV